MSPRRTDTGGRIDRLTTIRFTFDGAPYTGHAGDTLASALLANGVTLFGRSFKYHRPRGLLSAGVEEPNALVTVLKGEVREPNIPATMVEIHDGLVAVSQNRFPSLAWDINAVNQLGGKLLSAGFYYKTFMGPVFGPLKGTRFWMFCEHFIRRAAGLGRAGIGADPARYERMNAFCDVLVVGSGPAGLMAAKAAADQGARVILAELEPRFGGSANWSGETHRRRAGRRLGRRAVASSQAATMSGFCHAPRSGATTTEYAGRARAGQRSQGSSPRKGDPRHRYWAIRANTVVLATGALERPLVFPGNDRPGVMLAHAAERYANEFGVLPGERIALFTNNDSAYRAPPRSRQGRRRIAAIVDVRRDCRPEMRTPHRRRRRRDPRRPCGGRHRGRQGAVRPQGAALRHDDRRPTGDARSIHADAC